MPTLTIEDVNAAIGIRMMPWQRDLLRAHGIPTDEPVIEAPEPLTIKPHGDPTLGGSGLRIAVDADCPHCGWPERWLDTQTRKFGCIKCTYTSDERNG